MADAGADNAHSRRVQQRKSDEGGASLRARLVIGMALCLVGALWFGQGVGVVGGSFMTGQAVWAVFGAVAILFGASLFRRPRRSRRGDDE